MTGLLVIDKPAGMTSRDALNRVQRWFPRGTKLGHTGTLDPLATGVLVACVGAATKLAEYIQAMGKGYATRIRLGARSDTEDADGTVTPTDNAVPPTEEAVRAALLPFRGTIQQLPPAYSALKVGGVRAHELARAGREVTLAARPVRIDDVRFIRYEWPHLDLEIDCGKGTYVRGIARDIGEALGVGGLVQDLRRTRVGEFRAEAGVTLDATPEEAKAKLLPLALAVTGLPKVALSAEDIRRLLFGQRVLAERGFPAEVPGAVLDAGGNLKAVVTRDGPAWRVLVGLPG